MAEYWKTMVKHSSDQLYHGEHGIYYTIHGIWQYHGEHGRVLEDRRLLAIKQKSSPDQAPGSLQTRHLCHCNIISLFCLIFLYLVFLMVCLVFGIVYLVLIITSSSPCFRTSNVSQFTKCAQYTFLQLETHRWLGGNKKSSQPHIFIANDFNQWNNCSFLPIQQPNLKKK